MINFFFVCVLLLIPPINFLCLSAPTAATPYSTNKNKTDKYSFTYDKVFPPNAGQEEIYEELSQLVQVLELRHNLMFSLVLLL